MRRGTILGLLATTAALALVIGISVVWPGLDAKTTPPVDTGVWALQTQDGRRYARVNTAIGELDTVRSVANPSAVAQSDDAAYLFAESFGTLAQIDEAQPVDLDDESLRAASRTPAGTVQAVVAGDYVVYRTDSGAVFAGTLSGGDATQLDPFATGGADDDSPEYTAEAIAVDDDGRMYAYSQADGAVLQYRIDDATVVARDDLVGPDGDALTITAAGGEWFVIDLSGGTVWRAGDAPAVTIDLTGSAEVSGARSDGDAAYIADEAGLIALPVDGTVPERVVGGEAREFGTPAVPTSADGQVFAAWLRADAGVLWRSGAGETVIEYGGRTLGEERRPVFSASSGAMILNETRTGWVWTMPDAALVPSSQDWTFDEQVDPASTPSDEQATVVIDPKPPVAEPDAFGVRGGSLATLPVLLNDHDPNEDVLTIDPTSITGLDPGFGVVSITDSGQRLAVRVAPGAVGTAQFQYAVTDGTGEDGLRSEPVTVTLTVTGDEVNTAPQWCEVEGCLASWPSPEVAAGGTVSVPVLPAWVDAEGDPLLLLSVDNPSGVGAVASTPAGDLVYQHPDASDATARVVELQVTVSDTRGATTTRPLTIHVSSDPRPVAESFAVVDTVGTALTVDVADHVTGTAGALTLTAARVQDEAPADAVVATGGTTFDFVADEPGTYRVTYTVSDGAAEATATARITILPADAPAQLATSPVIAFVHPKEDVTLDVFAAVANPTRRVLLLSDVEPVADDGASMTVDVVAQSYLRVTGATDDGAPGRLGTVRYTVSDGTDDEGSVVRGEATVYLLPPAPQLEPIAVDDTVVVRAGAQVDIPVLDNDVAPSGGPLTLDPSSVESSAPDALAFGSGALLRYLAPAEPGQYAVTYRVFSTGVPSLADSATVRVTVIDDESNRSPRPTTLEGRVLSGAATTIPFEQFGVDPDGDSVSLDRITSQPESGSAALSADGSAIVYTSVPGYRGQVSFGYRVSDGTGATGTGVVRVGVLDEQANPSPVTFTDYVQVQVGASSTVQVSPLANDIDPTGGTLTLSDVRPDLPVFLADGTPNAEYDRLDAHLGVTDDRSVVITAGEDPGTMSFLYDTVSDSGNTARGLIVVKVVREAVPDFPVVADTVLTAQTREDFAVGVDVLDGKVSWTGGDIDDLTLSLWGDPDEVTVSGSRLRGELPEQSRIIAFGVTGEDDAGDEVTSYAFLRIPGADALSLALRTGIAPIDVTEQESASFDMRDLVALPRGAQLEVGGDLDASGARAQAACVREGSTGVRYDAGEGAPWADACVVPVRLAGQEDWTYLSVPIRVQALAPQPELRAASLTVGPGETATYDLTEMTGWQGRTDWDGIVYTVEYAGSRFAVSAAGSIVTVTGADSAVPGSEDVVTIGVSSHPGVASARLILRVGAAPSTLPQGGTVTQVCSQAQGSSCTITVTGRSGEVNPLPGTPLELVGVTATGACTGVTFGVASPTTVRADWADDAPGATCTASFSLRDAQGRQTNADRDGSLLLDLQGFPRAPAAISQIGFADGTVSLRVDPGPARQAYPALTGFSIRRGSTVVATCAPDGSCPDIAAPNGEERTYEAVAVNAVGSSRGSVTTVAWAYDTPPRPTGIVATPVVTGGEGELVSLRVSGVDPSEVGALEITSDTGETLRVRVGRGDETVDVARYRVGTNSRTLITVTPYSRFSLPPGLGGSTSGAAITVGANGVGAPRNPSLTLNAVSNGDDTATITANATATLGGDGSQLRYGFSRAGTSCTVAEHGPQATFTVADGEEHRYQVCVESYVSGRSYGRVTAEASVRAGQDTRAPTGFRFTVDPAPVYTAPGEARWRVGSAPTSTEDPPRRNDPEFRGFPSTRYGEDPDIWVRWTHRIWGATSEWARVTPAAGSAPVQAWATWGLGSCVGGSVLPRTSDATNAADGTKAAITFGAGGVVYRDAEGTVLPGDPDRPWLVPVGTARVDGVAVTVSWAPTGWNLANATDTISTTCDPNLPDPPEPDEPAP